MFEHVLRGGCVRWGAGFVLWMCCVWPVTALWAQPAAATHSTALAARLQAAQTSAPLAQQLYALGQKVATVCVHCHAQGKSTDLLEAPYLDGQNPAYLMEQMRQFAQGQRKNSFMQGILKPMTVDEMVGVVLFYAQAPLPARIPSDTARVPQGKAYYHRVCVACHGADGHGNARLPRIAGQHAGYVQLTLQRYRDGSHARSDANMAFVTRNMVDADIQAVAAYLETLP